MNNRLGNDPVRWLLLGAVVLFGAASLLLYGGASDQLTWIAIGIAVVAYLLGAAGVVMALVRNRRR